jgi:nitrogen fixation protein FixH
MSTDMSARDSINGGSARPNAAAPQATRQLTGRMVLICLIAFFAVIAGVNAIMIRAAVSTFGGVETGNAYQAGVAFAREIAAAEAQDALHWNVRAEVSAAPGATVLEITAADAVGRPLTGLAATARLMHPADKRADHIVALTEGAPGIFKGRTDAVAGQWAVVIELARDGTRMFRSSNRVFIR